MTNRQLSNLQKEYQSFFLEKLKSYEVISPSELTKEQKSEFFASIKRDWSKIKLANNENAIVVGQVSSVHENDSQQTFIDIVTELPRESIPQNQNSFSLEPKRQKILSLPNEDQTNDLKINYSPNSYFEQTSKYRYPVVKMPKKNASLKLPRLGRTSNRGYKEREFSDQLKLHIEDLQVVENVHMVIPNFNRPYEPDIVLFDKNLNLYIDIEIDEPYDGYYRYPTHCIKLDKPIKQDDIRDLFFTESGWVVIRFTERQVHLQVLECIDHIKNVINSIRLRNFNSNIKCETEFQWDQNQCIQWQKVNYREKYLGIVNFHKNYSVKEIEIDINENEGIEDIIKRTKKYDLITFDGSNSFDKETHKYFHTKDRTGNAEYISVTTLIERFFPFDLKRYIEKKAFDENRAEEEVLIEFLMIRDEAAERGTYLHNQIENYLKEREFRQEFTEFDLFLNFFNSEIKARNLQFYDAEKRIVSNRYNVAGTIDCLFKKSDKDEYVMLDWKRSKKLVIDGRPRLFGYGYALSELNHLDNSSYYKYCLQQNIYKYIVENEYGIKISSMKLVVLHDEYSEYYVVNVPNMVKEAKIILTHSNTRFNMDVLNEFIAAIEIERLKNLADFEAQMNQPLDERVAKGITMSNLRVEFEFYEGLPNNWCYFVPDSDKYIAYAKIYCENNISKFKEGSSVRLSNGIYKFEMEIEEDSPENFILKPNDFNVKNCSINYKDYPQNNWEINNIKSDITTKLLLTTAHLLSNDSTRLNRIENFLNGHIKNTQRNHSQKVAYLNQSQNNAYLNAINASDFCIIQGPPGTGKTETISNITKQLVEAGLKVFITAPTHTAINNCMNAISKKIGDGSKVVKIGEKAQSKEIKDNILTKTRLPYSNYVNSLDCNKNGIAIGATPHALCYPASRKLDGWEFDIVIIDEASQLSMPLAIAAISRAGKYIFVGDHKQLDPIIPKGTRNEMFAGSIFSRLAKVYPDDINLLNTSYRLNPSLIRIPNSLFYNDLLASDSTTGEDKAEYQCTYHPVVLNGVAHNLLLHNVFDAQGRSSYEAKFVAELVSDLIQNGVNLKDIGIMSPYRAQVREIKKEVKKMLSTTTSNSFDDLFVDTVDSMQGQERDFIIYSLSNSHPLESKTRLDFFYSPNRLNVAITRAIKKCIVIANYKIFDIKEEKLLNHEEYQNVKSSLEIFRQYYDLSNKIEINQTDEDEW